MRGRLTCSCLLGLAWLAAPSEARAAELPSQDEVKPDRLPSPPTPRTGSVSSAGESALLSDMRPVLELDQDFDWLRTNSGEWLKGRFQSMRGGELTFVSAHFGQQTLGWTAVAFLKLNHPVVVVLEDRSFFVGTGTLAAGELSVKTPDGERRVPRSKILSIVLRKNREISRWSFQTDLGISARTGNTESVDYTLFSRLRRVDRFTRFNLEYNGAYGLANDEEITNKHRGNFSWDWFISRAFYLTPLLGEALYDKFQNIALRSIVSSGAGFHVLNEPRFELDLEGSAGWIHGEPLSQQPGGRGDYDEALVTPKTVIKWSVYTGVNLELDWQSGLVVTDMSRTFHRGTSRLSVAITDVVNFSASAIYDRLERPVERDDGTTPEADDLALSIGLGIKLD